LLSSRSSASMSSERARSLPWQVHAGGGGGTSSDGGSELWERKRTRRRAITALEDGVRFVRPLTGNRSTVIGASRGKSSGVLRLRFERMSARGSASRVRSWGTQLRPATTAFEPPPFRARSSHQQTSVWRLAQCMLAFHHQTRVCWLGHDSVRELVTRSALGHRSTVPEFRQYRRPT
jgi:hypothetical protein